MKNKKSIFVMLAFATLSAMGVRAEASQNYPGLLVAAKTKKRKVVDQGTVDLSAMDAKDSRAPATTSPGGASGSPHTASSNAEPHFSAYFDLLLAYQPGKANFSFLNFHPLLFFEIIPTAEITFSFEVNPAPRFFELDYQANKWLQLRAGKIWIPFDDLSPHSLFGGLVDTSRLRLGNLAFLPDIWTDLGVGAKIILTDKADLQTDLNLYIVNGFGNTGTADPFGKSPDYPNFSDIPITQPDNNNDKAIGGRLHFLVARTFGFGLSFYTGRWTSSQEESDRINALALDASLRMGKTDLRLGIAYMKAGLIGGGSYGRNGEYLEISHKLGKNEEWRLLGRVGYVDPDDRFTDINDTLWVGGGVRWKPGLIQWALEFYRDLKYVQPKTGYTFTCLRTIIML